ncbi:MAG: glycosyltransferase family 39 protein, partial [Anaerolineae bacterium]
MKFWLLLALLAAAFLRLYRLSDAPPGLTHDEADHGLTAWQIVQGARELYFPIGYGREPLFDYATAGMMALTGRTVLAGRLTAVYASLLLVAAMAAWVRLAFGRQTAVLTAAGLALSFWPVMTGRQMLRSTLLPTLFVLALLFFWQALIQNPKSKIQNPLLAGLFLGLTFYVYLPARVLW